MRFGIRRVDKLAGNKAVWNLRSELVCFCNRAFHAFGAVGQHQFRAVGFHQLTAFHRHSFGHHDDNPVAFCCCHGRKTDTGIAGRRFDNDRTGLQLAALFGVFNHGFRNTVLDRTGRIEVFQLREQLCFQIQ